VAAAAAAAARVLLVSLLIVVVVAAAAVVLVVPKYKQSSRSIDPSSSPSRLTTSPPLLLLLYHHHQANLDAINLDHQYFASCEITNDATNYNSYYRQLYYTHKHSFLAFAAMMNGQSSLVNTTINHMYTECDLMGVAQDLGGVFAVMLTWRWL